MRDLTPIIMKAGEPLVQRVFKHNLPYNPEDIDEIVCEVYDQTSILDFIRYKWVMRKRSV